MEEVRENARCDRADTCASARIGSQNTLADLRPLRAPEGRKLQTEVHMIKPLFQLLKIKDVFTVTP